MSAAALLEMSLATARRGTFTAGPFSLRVDGGQCVGVVGPNGAGKSTLLALASGAMAPSSGEVLLAGRSASRINRSEAAHRVASLSPIAPPSFEVSVLEVVLHGRWAHLSGWRFAADRDVAIAREALARTGAAALADRDARTLSSGELQRVLLAKALAQEAPLILLDEPTASLDIVQRASVRRLLDAARSEGLGLVVVTHDLEMVAEACDQVILLASGKVVAAGPASEVLAAAPLSEAFGVSVKVERTPGGRARIEA